VHDCHTVLAVLFPEGEGRLSARADPLAAFVSLQEMTNASAAVTADSSRIKFNRLILIPFFLSFTKFYSLHAV